jgi:protein subunit release factor B
MISPEKQHALKLRLKELHVDDNSLEEQFVQGSGKGGQKINKTSSCVILKHLPSGLVIKCQESRSRELNRYYARKMLCDKLEGKDSKKAKDLEKAKKQKKRRKRRSNSTNLKPMVHEPRP